MEGRIDADTPLEYATFQILPTQNRYEAFVCGGNKVEKLASGLLEHLMQHLPEVKGLCSKGSNSNFILQPPKNLKGAGWFTKSILTRFLNIVNTPDVLVITNTIEDEMCQLEETRRFHFSLYAQGHQDHSGGGKLDGSTLKDMEATEKNKVENVSTDASKNELMRAMDLRITALGGELASAFNNAAGATCSLKEIAELIEFSQQFGAAGLRKSLCKYLELMQNNQAVVYDPKGGHTSSVTPRCENKTNENTATEIPRAVNSIKPVKYNVSPAKAAQVERQSSSTESDESSYSSDEGRKTSADRSRTLIRSASPRRSASPMRRIQIGRSGSRRATALTIKSLSFIPASAKEKAFSQRGDDDGAATDSSGSGADDESRRSRIRKPENSARRMSVQDAINLFESKQRDRSAASDNIPVVAVGPSKPVLRRWSSSLVGDSSAQFPTETFSDASVSLVSNNLVDAKSSEETKPEPDLVEASETDAKLDEIPQEDISTVGGEETSERLTSSMEWTRQKEAELNQMLMKMMESKPTKSRNHRVPENSRNQDAPSKPKPKQKGGFYDQYKEKRDEKLRGENAGKRAEKDAQFKAMQKVFHERKAEMASPSSTSTSNVGKKTPASRTSSQSSISTKRETLKPAVAKKASPKTSSPLPTIRKSWPSTPLPRATGTSPAKTNPNGVSSAGTTPTRQKTQSTQTSLARSTPTQNRPKNVKGMQTDAPKSLKNVNEKKQPTVTKGVNKTKAKAPTTASTDVSGMVPLKPGGFYGKGTKKSSVVPVESKPFLRKGSGIGPVVVPAVKTKVSSQSQDEDDVVVVNTCEPITQQEQDQEQEREQEEMKFVPVDESLADASDIESAKLMESRLLQKHDENPDQVVEAQEEESSIISPNAWVEIEEHEGESGVSEIVFADTDNIAPVAFSSPRVRHSLSQMLLEESSESDINEWGNAENPPAIVYHKDAPRGFKRLLKFARKSKGDPSVAGTGWSSPSVVSEGEDDAEEFKAITRRNSDHLLRAALHGQHKNSFQHNDNNFAPRERLSAQSNISKFSGQNLGDGAVASTTTTKATRSFFFSAFRGGNKPN